MFGLLAIVGGVLLVWAGATGTDPVAEMRAVLAGKPRPERASSTGGGASSSPGTPAGSTPGTYVAGTLPTATVAAYAYKAGFRGEQAVTAVAVAMAESSGQTGIVSPTNDVGVWQINVPSHPNYDPQQLKDPAYNANAAYAISGGGANWSPWTTYKSGRYRQFLELARSAVAAVESSTSGSLGPTTPTGLPPKPNGSPVDPSTLGLLLIGQGNHRLARPAALAFKSAELVVHRPIMVTDSFRTYAQQQTAAATKPGLAAKAGTSLHEVGLAVDIIEQQAADIKAALEGAGWTQWNRLKEPWHWSYGYTG